MKSVRLFDSLRSLQRRRLLYTWPAKVQVLVFVLIYFLLWGCARSFTFPWHWA